MKSSTRDHNRSHRKYASILPLLAVLILSLSCEWIMNEDEDPVKSIVLEIKSDPTFFIIGESGGFHYNGIHEYDLYDSSGTLSIYGAASSEYYSARPYLLIMAREEFVHGDCCEGHYRVLTFHESLPVKIPYWSGPILMPDSLHILNLDDDKIITLVYKDSTFSLMPHSSKIWLDSMYVQHDIGAEFFVIDSITFIHHGELALDISE